MQTEDRLKIQANPITQKGVELKNHKKPTIFQKYSRICDSVLILFNGNKIIWNVLI